MPRTPIHLASGTGVVLRDYTAKAIRFVRYGCTNRPFFHIVVMEVKKYYFLITDFEFCKSQEVYKNINDNFWTIKIFIFLV